MRKLLLPVVFCFLSLSAYAADFKLGPVDGSVYGELYVSGYYEKDNKYFAGISEDAHSFDVFLETRSRLGIVLNYGGVSFTFEAGADPDDYLRLYYLTYDFGRGGALTAGKDWTVAAYSFGQEALEGNALCDYGTLNDYRLPMIKYSVAGFEIAVAYTGDDAGVDDSVSLFDTVPVTDPVTGQITDATVVYSSKKLQYVPRIEAAYSYENDFAELRVFGSYGRYGRKIFEKYDPVSGVYADKSYEADVYSVGVGGTLNAADGYVSFAAFYGTNLYLSGALTTSSLAPTFKKEYVSGREYETGDLRNVNSWGGALGFGYTLAGMFTPQIGAGYSSSSSSPWSRDDQSWGGYVNVVCQLNDYVALIPEVSYLDDMKDGYGEKQGDRLFAGLVVRGMF